MATTDFRLVCLFDVLGFESLLRRLGLAGLHQKSTPVLVEGALG